MAASAIIVDALLAGQVEPFGGETSAIAKVPVDGMRRIGVLGIEGDAQADLRVHGGHDKAIHHYPRDHYPFWRDLLGDVTVLATSGAFGENISTHGLTEGDACLGDRYRLGSALLEICQGRQPCWKQAHRLGFKGAVAVMVSSGKSGWYYRVIEEGDAAAGDRLDLVNRPLPSWPIERVTGLLIGGKARSQPAAARDLSRLDVLAEGWRQRAARFG